MNRATEGGKWLVNCRWLVESGEVVEGNIEINHEGKINRLVKKGEQTTGFDGEITQDKVDIGGRLVTPGLIDLQLNGGWGHYFTYSADTVDIVAKRVVEYGVTSFLATAISTTDAQYRKVLPTMQPRNVEGGARVLGIHLEGPFLNVKKKGAHPEEELKLAQNLLRSANSGEEALTLMFGSLEGVKLVTLAPELEGGMGIIDALQRRGIGVAVGHSEANMTEMEEAERRGAKLVTHLFNAMNPLHHREVNLPGWVLTQDSMCYSVIADGIHVHPRLLKLMYRAHSKGLILVSDAMSALGLPDGADCGIEHVRVRGGRAEMKDSPGTLAGSTLRMHHAVTLLHKEGGATLWDSLRAATSRPAHLIGMEKEIGSLSPGMQADIAVWSDFTLSSCSMTFVAGRLVYSAS